MKRLEEFADSVVKAVVPYLARNLSPLVARLKSIEDWRASVPADLKGEPGKDGAPGKDAPAVDVGAVVAEVVKLVPAPKDGANGKDADSEAITSVVLEKVMKAMDEIPMPKDGAPGRDGKDGEPGPAGKDGTNGVDGKDADPLEIKAAVESAVAAIPLPKDGTPGADGKSVDVQELRSIVSDEVVRAVAEIPKPKDGADGKDIDQAVVVALVQGEVAKTVSELPPPKAGERGERGEKGDPVDTSLVVAEIERQVAAIPRPADGKSVDMGEVTAMVAKAVSEMPKPQDGKDGASVDPAVIADMVAKAVDAIPRPKDGERGKDADPEFIKSEVARAVAAIPAPKDGSQGPAGDRGEPGVRGEQGQKGADGADGKSIDLEDIRPLFEAKMATWQVDFERHAGELLQRAYDRMPKPKNGEPGRDGLSIEDFDATVKEDGRTIVISLRAGDQVVTKELRLSVPVARGIYKAGAYEKDDVTTWGGSWWIALQDTTEPPGGESKHWKLTVKRGRDGKDAVAE